MTQTASSESRDWTKATLQELTEAYNMDKHNSEIKFEFKRRGIDPLTGDKISQAA